MKAICEGRKTRREVVDDTIEQYRAVYVRTQQHLNMLQAVSFDGGTLDLLHPLTAT